MDKYDNWYKEKDLVCSLWVELSPQSAKHIGISVEHCETLPVVLFVFLPDCKHHLSEPELKLVWPSSKLLQAACNASNRASHIITAAVMPSLVEQYNSRAQVKQGQLISKGLFSLT